MCIPDAKPVCLSTSGVDHLRRGIDPEDLALGSDLGRYGQSGLSGPSSNIQNGVAKGDPRLLDQSLRDRRKHEPDVFAVLLPEGRGVAPSLDNLLVGLHLQKYT